MRARGKGGSSQATILQGCRIRENPAERVAAFNAENPRILQYCLKIKSKILDIVDANFSSLIRRGEGGGYTVKNIDLLTWPRNRVTPFRTKILYFVRSERALRISMGYTN